MYVACITMGGPEYRIRVGTKIYLFEDHRYCGPIALRKDTKASLSNQPMAFLKAVSLWAQQGRKVDKQGWAIYKKDDQA